MIAYLAWLAWALWQTPSSDFDRTRQVLDHAEQAVWAAPGDAILDAVAHVESRSRWWLVGSGCAGKCWGAYQQSGAYADVPTWLLFVPPVARWQANRKLTALLEAHSYQLLPALAAYNCGTAGARRDTTGECLTYARQVLRVARSAR